MLDFAIFAVTAIVGLIIVVIIFVCNSSINGDPDKVPSYRLCPADVDS
jgi:L-asparagine transporter-like permease